MTNQNNPLNVMKKFLVLFLSILFSFNSAFAESDLESNLQILVDDDEIAGAVVVVANKDKVLEFITVGYANKENQVPIQKDSLFRVASQTKPMTALAVMILVEAGKLSLDDEVSKYIPEYANLLIEDEDGTTRPPKNKMIVRDLLSHSSGLAGGLPALSEMNTLEFMVKEFANSPLKCEPSTKHIYSNVGMISAGRVVEVTSGMPYAEFMKEKIFTPLEMHDTTFTPTEKQLKRFVTIYKRNADNTGIVAIDDRAKFSNPRRQPLPGNGLFSTAPDILNFCQMIANDGVFKGKRIVSSESVKEMTKKQTYDAPTYGLGWGIDKNFIGHDGSAGTRMRIYNDKDQKIIKIFLSQYAGDCPLFKL